MLDLKKPKDITVDKFLSQIGKSLGQEAESRASRPEISIVCKDIDEVITKNEVREVLREELDLIGIQETAIIRLPVEAALKLLAGGRVKIGWVMYCLRERESIIEAML